MSLIQLISMMKKSASAGGGGSTPLTYDNVSPTLTTEADGGVTTNSAVASSAHSVQSITAGSSEKFTYAPTGAISNLLVCLVAAADKPATARNAASARFLTEFWATNIWVDGGATSAPVAGMTEMQIGFNGSGEVVVLRNGVNIFTSSGFGGSGEYFLRVWVDGGAPTGTGVSSASVA